MAAATSLADVVVAVVAAVEPKIGRALGRSPPGVAPEAWVRGWAGWAWGRGWAGGGSGWACESGVWAWGGSPGDWRAPLGAPQVLLQKALKGLL